LVEIFLVGSGIFVYFCKRDVSVIQGHPRSLNLLPIESALCDFLLVHHSNHGPILHRFRDFARFLCSWPTPIPP